MMMTMSDVTVRSGIKAPCGPPCGRHYASARGRLNRSSSRTGARRRNFPITTSEVQVAPVVPQKEEEEEEQQLAPADFVTGVLTSAVEDYVHDDVCNEVELMEDANEVPEYEDDECEDILSLASHDSWDADDKQIEAANYVNMAVDFARKTAARSLNEECSHDSLRMQLRDILVSSGRDGSLKAALGDIQQQKQDQKQKEEELRLEARGALLKSLADGRLSAALKQATEETQQQEIEALRLEARDKLLKATASGRLAEALKQAVRKDQEDQIEGLRQQAREKFLEGVANGRLSAALQKLKKKNEEEMQQKEMEALRLEARANLLKASASGRLAEALKEAVKKDQEKQQLETLRVQARDKFLEGIANGRVSEALNQKRKEKDALESMRLKVLEGFSNGGLEKALRTIKEKREKEELEELRLETRDIFMEAQADGRLSAALKAVQQKRQKEELLEKKRQEEELLEKFRVQALSTISKAAFDGSLVTALKEIRDERRQVDEMNALRAEAQQTLFGAARNGRLAAALEEVRKEREANALRTEAKNTLVKSLQDGSLQKMLAQHFGSKSSHDVPVSPLGYFTLCAAYEDASVQPETPLGYSPVREAYDDIVQPEAQQAISFEESTRLKMRGLVIQANAEGVLENLLKSEGAPVAAPVEVAAVSTPSKTQRRLTRSNSKPTLSSDLLAASSTSLGPLVTSRCKTPTTSAMFMDLGMPNASKFKSLPQSKPTSRLATLGESLVSDKVVKTFKAAQNLQPLTSSKSTGSLVVVAVPAATTNANVAIAGSVAWSQRMSRKSHSVGRLGAAF